MATTQQQLQSALSYLLEKVVSGSVGCDDQIDVQAFRDELEEMLEDIETALRPK